MKNYFLIVVIVLCFLMTSCSIRYQKYSSEEKFLLFENELNKWKHFKISGMCDIVYSSFNIIRPCVVAKSSDKIRFDVFDSGIFGLGGGIFTAFYADDKMIQYKLPGNSTITTKTLDDKMIAWFDFLSESMFKELESNKVKIINNQYAMIRNIEFFFYPNMQLKEIKNVESEIFVWFEYNKFLELAQIKISSPLIKNLTISIDKIDYSDNLVIPLKK
ncbi:MAG: hypothetical protein PHY08_04395 [Candidatus Cloacimonetes bacterium]|nr:hypothetical protein [Candidatus Cloacimonadota bacterium]MDD4155794.1 hypothetical protein [Candidatus Cloacimonadota bacterium]